MYLGGNELREVHENAPRVDSETKSPMRPKEYSDAIARLDSFYAATANRFYELDKLDEIKQDDDENFDKFFVRLKLQAARCGFEEKEIDWQVQRRISKGAKLQKVRVKAYEADVKLDKVVEYAHQQETTIEKGDEKPQALVAREVNAVRADAIKKSGFGGPRRACFACGNTDHFKFSKRCKAKNSRCNNCNKVGHFAKMCRAEKVELKRTDEREPVKVEGGWEQRVKSVNQIEN